MEISLSCIRSCITPPKNMAPSRPFPNGSASSHLPAGLSVQYSRELVESSATSQPHPAHIPSNTARRTIDFIGKTFTDRESRCFRWSKLHQQTPRWQDAVACVATCAAQTLACTLGQPKCFILTRVACYL